MHGSVGCWQNDRDTLLVGGRAGMVLKTQLRQPVSTLVWMVREVRGS